MDENRKAVLHLRESPFVLCFRGLSLGVRSLGGFDIVEQVPPGCRKADICISRLSLAASSEFDCLSALDPGEGYSCSSTGDAAIYFSDGWVDSPERGGPCINRVVLLANGHFSLVGAVFGAVCEALSRLGALVLHAAVVRYLGRNVLAVGPSGGGKSTLAAAVMASGGRVLSDDNVAIDVASADSAIMAFPLRHHPTFRKGTLGLFADRKKTDLRCVELPRERKWMLDRDRHADLFASSLGVDEVWILDGRNRGRATRAEPLQMAAALSSLLGANPYLQSLDGELRETVLHQAIRLVQRVPTRLVCLGTNLLTEPRRELESLLGDVEC